jgi:hypothetical protein
MWSPTTEVVNDTHARCPDKFLKGTHHNATVNLVTHLLAFVTEDGVMPTRHGVLDQVREETVELHPAVVRTGKTTPAKADSGHIKIVPVFLDHQVRRSL